MLPRPTPRFRSLTHLVGVLALGTAAAQEPTTRETTAPRPLEHGDTDLWRTIEDEAITDAGGWIVYGLAAPDGGDGAVIARATDSDTEWRVELGENGAIDVSESLLLCILQPAREDLRAFELQKREGKNKKGKKKDKLEKPVTALGLLDLASGELTRVERVKSFELPEERGRWYAYLHHEPLDDEKAKDDDDESPEEAEAEGATAGAPEPGAAPEVEREGITGEEPAPAAEEPAAEEPAPEKPVEEPAPEEPAEPERAEYDHEKDKKDGTELVLAARGGSASFRIDSVLDYTFSRDGRWLAVVTSTKDGEGDSVQIVGIDPGDGDLEEGGTVEFLLVEVLAGEGNYRSLAFDENSTQLAFLTNRDDWESEAPAWSLYRADVGGAAELVAELGTAGLPEGWAPGEHQAPSFSEDGTKLYFGSAPAPEPEPEEPFDDERVTLDLWSWTDSRIQPEQLVDLKDDRQRTYRAVAHLGGDAPRIVQLADETLPNLRRARGVDVDGVEVARFALGTSDLPYEHMRSWESRVPSDAYVVDLESGERRRVLEGRRTSVQISPGGRYLAWWDYDAQSWWALATAGGDAVDVGAALPHPLHHEPHDTPNLPRAEGAAGWLYGDGGLLLYDAHDLWQVDPSGKAAPRCLTGGLGRERNLRFRLIDLDREAVWIDPAEPWLLRALDLDTKAESFWRLDAPSGAPPEKLVESDHRYGTPRRAKDSDELLYTRESYVDFPDLWVASNWTEPGGFEDARRLSDANPQQADYLWGTSESVRWTSANGEELEGILYRPDGHDDSRPAPLMVYFYEKMSERLNAHYAPIPSRSTIRFPFYTSRGYLVFVPDIPYRTGRPGPSALNAVVPGVLELIDRGLADPDAIGVQGHSWGGYQIAYMVTQTDLFTAAVAGAPVSNMTSAYGGVRYGSGLSRMFQYEETQSRIGGTLWDALPKYLENSPVFYADQVETPLLMLHNDEDGAVPWTQGIEMFLALRRLGKPSWLLNYNGEKHGIGRHANRRDYAQRMQQFFDHYLLGEPAPPWLERGLPALEKGRSLGF